jgi:hypothetical protein
MPWFRFGLLLLVAVKTVMLLAGMRRRFKATNTVFDGKEHYDYAVARNRNRQVTGVAIGVSIADNLRFVLRREHTFDRLAKWLGIAREWQTRDRDFDNSVYILSDDRVLLQALSQDAELREAAQALLGNERVGAIHCYRGSLWVDLHRISRDLHESVDTSIAAALLPAVQPDFQKFRERLAAIQARPWAAERDPADTREQILLLASSVIGITGIAAFFWTEGVGLPRQLSYAVISSYAATLAAVVGAIFLLVLVTLIGRTARTHLVLLEILLVTVPGAWFAGRAYYAFENERLDPSAALEFRTHISHVYYTSGKSRSYHLVLERALDPRLQPDMRVALKVYSQFHAGDCARFDLHPGRFGDLWLAAIVPDTRCDTPADDPAHSQTP